MQLFDLHYNAGEFRKRAIIPDGFVEVYLCDYLGMSYSELQQQPAWWVERMVQWLDAKNNAQAVRAKLATKSM